MNEAPEIVEIDEDSFPNIPLLAAAGVPEDFFEEDRMNAWLEAGEAFQIDDHPNFAVLNYPSAEGGVAMLLRWLGDAYGLVNAWPFLPTVISAEIAPLKLAVDAEGVQAFVTARMGGAVLTFFDDGFIENGPAYRAAEIAYAQFYGIANQAAPAEATEFEIGPDDEEFGQLVAAGHEVAEGGAIRISMAGAAIMVPRFDIAPNAFEFRGPVVGVEPLPDWICPDAAVVHVTVLRPFEDEDGTPLEDGFDLPILMRPGLIDGEMLPQPGEEMQGIAFLYGTGFEGDPGDDDDDEVPPPLLH